MDAGKARGAITEAPRVPLIVELSNDRSTWQAVAQRESPFAIWEPSFAPSKARYVRLRVPRVTFLHLEQVKVY